LLAIMQTDAVRRIIAVGAVVHALAITAIWAAMFYADIAVLSGPIWLVFAWLWLTWPVSLVVARRNIGRLTVAAVVASAVILLPTITTMYTFTVWSIGGFAP
jgi:hypothetical protein